MADRKKMLEALVAKRKAEAEGGRHKPKTSSLFSKPVSVNKSSPVPYNPRPSPLLKQQHLKKDSPPKKKKKRVEKYDTEDDDDGDEESDEDSYSEDEPVKKAPLSKGRSAVKTSSSKPASLKSTQDVKGKVVAKEKDPGKGQRKNADSSDDNGDVGSDEEDDEADSGDEGLDRSNILPERSRRRGSQTVQYDFTNMSDDDDDSD